MRAHFCQPHLSQIGGPRTGEKCSFPFSVAGEEHHACTTHLNPLRSPPHWCSTEVDSEGNFVRGRWGYCSEENCPIEEEEEETVMGIQSEEETDRRGLSPFSEEMLPIVVLDDDEDPNDDVTERGDFLPSLGQCYYREIDGLINRIQELKETGFSPPYEKCNVSFLTGAGRKACQIVRLPVRGGRGLRPARRSEGNQADLPLRGHTHKSEVI